MIFFISLFPASPVGVAAGTRKRNRRHSSALDDEHFFTGFADSSDSDKAWEQILQILDGEDEEAEEAKRKKKRGRYKRKVKEDDSGRAHPVIGNFKYIKQGCYILREFT